MNRDYEETYRALLDASPHSIVTALLERHKPQVHRYKAMTWAECAACPDLPGWGDSETPSWPCHVIYSINALLKVPMNHG